MLPKLRYNKKKKAILTPGQKLQGYQVQQVSFSQDAMHVKVY